MAHNFFLPPRRGAATARQRAARSLYKQARSKMNIHSNKAPLPGRGDLVASLCPSMDLVSLAAAGHVLLYRSVDWDRLFNLPSSLGSKSLAWRPDGMQVAVGNKDGSVSILLVVSSSDRPSSSFVVSSHKDAITALHWTAKRLARPIPRLAHLPVVPPLPSVVQLRYGHFDTAGSKPAAPAHTEIEPSLLNGPCLDVLVCGDQGGIVTLSAFGDLVVGCIDLADCFPGQSSAVARVKLSHDLATLATVMRRHTSHVVVTIGTRLLASEELAHVASAMGAIGRDTAACQQALAAAGKVWEELCAAVARHFAPLSSPDEQLFELSCFGARSPALVTYLEASCSAAAVAKLSRALDGLFAAVSHVLAAHVIPLAQTLLIRASSLRGYALGSAAELHAPLGVDSALADALLAASEELVGRALALAGRLPRVKAQLQQLLEWAAGCAARLQGQAGAAACAPAPGVKRALDDVAVELGAVHEPAAAPSWDRAAARQKKQRVPAETAGGLVRAAGALASWWKQALPAIAHAVSNSFHIVPTGLPAFECADDRSLDAACVGDELYVAFGDGATVHVWARRGSGGSGGEWTQSRFALPSGTCTDVRFYCASPGKPLASVEQAQLVVAATSGVVFLFNLDGAVCNQYACRGAVTGLECSGPRGVVLVLTRGRVELVDMVAQPAEPG